MSYALSFGPVPRNLFSVQPVAFQDHEIIEIPIEISHEFGPFEAWFAGVSRRAAPRLGKIPVQMEGVPEWPDPYVKRLILDMRQFVHQNAQKGLIDSTWAKNVLDGPGNLLDQDIRCYTHIVFDKDANGTVLLKVDADGDGSFADEPERRPLPSFPCRDDFVQKHDLDSVVKSNTVLVKAEFAINGKVEEMEVPILLLATKGGDFAMNMPIHAKASLLGTDLRVSARQTLSFSTTSDLVIDANQSSTIYAPATSPPRIKKGEFLKISDNYFQNLGVDFHDQVLRLRKMPEDTILYSSQVGFKVSPFEASTLRDGRLVSLNDYQDKFLYMEFWGTWCTPCVEDVPNLIDAYGQIDTAQVAFLGIAQDDPDRVLNFVEKRDLPWDQLVSSDENDLVKQYNVTGFPTSILVDPDGVIVAKDVRGDKLLDTLNHYVGLR